MGRNKNKHGLGESRKAMPVPNSFRLHPDTGLKTPCWTLREVSVLYGVDRYVLYDLYNRGAIPETVYGTYKRGALFSQRQVRLIGSLLYARTNRLKFKDPASQKALSHTITALRKEWNNDQERKGGDDGAVRRWAYEAEKRERRALDPG